MPQKTWGRVTDGEGDTERPGRGSHRNLASWGKGGREALHLREGDTEASHLLAALPSILFVAADPNPPAAESVVRQVVRSAVESLVKPPVKPVAKAVAESRG